MIVLVSTHAHLYMYTLYIHIYVLNSSHATYTVNMKYRNKLYTKSNTHHKTTHTYKSGLHLAIDPRGTKGVFMGKRGGEARRVARGGSWLPGNPPLQEMWVGLA